MCFWALAGGRPMAENKKSLRGYSQRIDVLRTIRPSAEEEVQAILASYLRKEVARDDVPDAMAAAITAAQDPSLLQTFPVSVAADRHGLPMEMVFACRPSDCLPDYRARAGGSQSRLAHGMNDPHVVVLHYKIDHASWVDYSGAGAFDRREDAFDVHVEDGHVHFTMKTHFATERDARCLVEDYVRSWELHAVLEGGPGTFRLRFDWADIEDRSPTLGVVSLAARPITATVTMSKAQLTVSPSTYPSPPATSLERSPDVESMLRRYLRYFEDRDRLPEMANFCLTVLVASAGGRGAPTRRIRYGFLPKLFTAVVIAWTAVPQASMNSRLWNTTHFPGCSSSSWSRIAS